MLLAFLLLLAFLMIALPFKPDDRRQYGTPSGLFLPTTDGHRDELFIPAQKQDLTHRSRRSHLTAKPVISSGAIRPGTICLICGLPQNQGEHRHG
jgi:hypothetical protein